MIVSQGDSILAGDPFSREYAEAGAIVSTPRSIFFRRVSAFRCDGAEPGRDLGMWFYGGLCVFLDTPGRGLDGGGKRYQVCTIFGAKCKPF
jgi:hypothetical protein